MSFHTPHNLILNFSYIKAPSPNTTTIVFYSCSLLNSCVLTTMFDSTLELITWVACNSIFAFCFCNLIIAVILIASKSKQGPNCNQESHVVPFSTPTKTTNTCTNGNEAVVAKHSLEGNKMLIDVSRASDAHETPITKDEENDNGDGNKDDESDEFRRRVEEFINKVNRGWKAESMRR